MELLARFISKAAGWLLLVMMALIARTSVAQNANDGFYPNANGVVRALAMQADGKIVVGGDFTSIGGQAANHVARLNPDGSLDSTFTASVDNSVYAIVIQADGRVVVGGAFTQADTSTRTYVARFNTDGSLDTAFNANVSAGMSLLVSTLALQSDGKLIIGGTFFTVANQTRNYIARLNADGTLDATYNANLSYGIGVAVNVLTLQSDGKVLAGGVFFTVSTQTRNYVARLNADGTLDGTFNANLSVCGSCAVNTVTVQPNGKVVVGGTFTMVSGQARNYISRLNFDGTLDAGFNANISTCSSCAVNAVAVQPDGRVVFGGLFSLVGGQSRNFVARLNIDDTLDTAFNPNPNSSVNVLAVQSDDQIVVGGAFTSMGGQTCNYVARLNTDGSTDATLNPGADNTVYAFSLQPDGNLIVGGVFTSIGGQSGKLIARLHADGTVDTAYNPNPNNGGVIALAMQPDGKVLVGGSFTSIAGQTRNDIARLNSDGTVDTGFSPPTTNAGSEVQAVAIQPDGKVLIGGSFTSLGGQPWAGVARLNADGGLDTTFNANANAGGLALALQPDGKLVVGGFFSSIGGQPSTYLARLNSDGSSDSAFNPNVGFLVIAIALQPNGKIIVAGNGIARLNADGSVDNTFSAPSLSSQVTTLALQTDGKLLIGGNLSTVGGQPRTGMARLNADGSLDATFNANASNSVYALALQPDGKIIAGGAFAAIGGQTRNCIARLTTQQASLQSIDIVGYTTGGSRISWTREGPGPEVSSPPQVESSSDGILFSVIGTMQRATNGWLYTGFIPPLNQNAYLRVSGLVTSGDDEGSSGLIENTHLYFINGNDGIFADGFGQ